MLECEIGRKADSLALWMEKGWQDVLSESVDPIFDHFFQQYA
jgi:hypothetical protein